GGRGNSERPWSQLQRFTLDHIETVRKRAGPAHVAVKEASPSPPPATQEIAKGSKSSEDLRRKRRAVVGLRIVRAPEGGVPVWVSRGSLTPKRTFPDLPTAIRK